MQGRTESLSGYIEESERVGRFLRKLLGEAHHLQATQILFTTEGDTLKVSLLKEKLEVKASEARSSWFEPLSVWLTDRISAFSEKMHDVIPHFDRRAHEYTCTAAVRLGESLLQMKVERSRMLSGKSRLVLSEFSASPVRAILDGSGFSGQMRGLIEQILVAKSGLVLAGGPRQEDVLLTTSMILALSDAHLVSRQEFLRTGSGEEIGTLSHERLLVTPVQGHDPAEVLGMVGSERGGWLGLDLVGVLIQGFAKRVCAGCARSAVIDSTLLHTLPEIIRPANNGSYRVGMGCGACSQRGFHGRLGIQSILPLGGAAGEILRSQGVSLNFLQKAYTTGFRSLLEDGIRKATSGSLTLESLFEVVRTVPQSYLNFRNSLAASTEAEVAPLSDVLLADGDVEAPLRGTSAFAHNPDSLSEEPFQRGHREHPVVLVVEDDPDQRAILEMVLKEAKYDVRTAINGSEALKNVEREIPDVIVTDLMMPVMDGSALVGYLKAHQVFKNIPVLILTVVSDSAKEYDLLNLGADDYCEKTIQRKILLKRVEKLARRSAAIR